MDGTLTIPNLDFDEMYDRCGVDRKDDILQVIATMDEASAARANAIIEEMEEEGRRTLQLMPGTLSLLQWLAYYQIPTALVTRNTHASTLRLLELLREADPELPSFSPIISRDFQPAMLPKPHIVALEYIAKEWKMALTEELVMVGDSPSNDIVFGKNAGVSTALLWQQGDCNDDNNGGADVVVSQLVELPRHLCQCFTLPPPPVGLDESPTTAPRPTSSAGEAAYSGDLDTLRSLSFEGITAKDDTGNTPLIWASEAGQAHVVEYLLGAIASSNSGEQHPDQLLRRHVNEKGYRGSTAVSRAARNGHLHLVATLTKNRVVNANIPNVKLQYPLHVAAFRQHSSIVQALLQAGADPHVIDLKGRTPLVDTKCPKTKEILRSAMESPFVCT